MHADYDQPHDRANAGDAGNFRDVLRDELARRCSRNPQYSLRAFAMDLGVDHASLSQWIRGRRTLTERTIRQIGPLLGLTDAQIASCVSHEALQRPTGPHADGDDGAARQIAADTAEVVAHDHHYAILELTRLAAFRPDTRWIARVLDLSPDEINVALQRLLRLGMLEMRHDRWLDLTGDAAATVEDFTRLALQRFADRIQRSARSSDADRAAERSVFSSTTLAVNSAHLPAVRGFLSRTRDELLAILRRDASCDDVYQLEIAFFPVTRIHPIKEQPDGTTRGSMADHHPQSRASD